MRSALIGLLLLAACENGPGQTLGDPQLRVLDGDGQSHVAALVDSLDAPVRAQLYRTVEGGITFRLVTPLHAQTGVVGVPGETVCAVPVGERGLEPWNPCANTGVDGIALFWFEPGTKAGEYCAEVRAQVGGVRMVTDSVCAVVEPGPASAGKFFNRTCDGLGVQMDTLDLRLWADAPPAALTDEFGNVLDFRLVPFQNSRLYSVTPDGKRLVALPNVAGLDSVRVQDASRGRDAVYWYVRVRSNSDPKIVIQISRYCQP